MKRLMVVCLTIMGVCLLTHDAGAGKVKTWHHDKPADHERAIRQGVVMSDTGMMSLSRKLKPVGALDATHVWAVAEDADGNLYAGTGDEGKVYRITPQGTEVVYTSEGQVLCLTTANKGQTVYAGTGPNAQVVQIDAKVSRVLCTLPESYIWSLAADPKTQSLYAATGPNGRIYRITAEGKANVFYETKQDHVLSLVMGGDGNLYAGTDKTGRVYRIDARGKGFVLYQATQAEIRTLLWTDGGLYAGTSATKKRESTATTVSKDSTESTSARVSKPSATLVSSTTIEKPTRTATGKTAGKTKETKKGKPAPAPSEPETGENSVYRISTEGIVREVFRDKVLVLSLAHRGNRLLVGTGMKGQLFEVNERRREKTELARLDHGQILGLCVRKDGSLAIAAGDPGKVHVMEERFQSRGTVVSNVLDAKLISRWGQIRLRSGIPARTGIQVAVRSGNVEKPDDTWSDWSAPQSGEEITPTVPAARYLQYRVTLTSEDGRTTPTVKSLTLRYATGNQAPEITKLVVPDLATTTLEKPKKLKFEWTATDANEDELRYQLYVKKDGWDEWVLIEEDMEKTEYEWDTTTTPSGVYRLKIVASDHINNDEQHTLTGERISEPFTVCHVAPTVTLEKTGVEEGRMVLKAKATSPIVRLVSASYSINSKKWVNVFPTDGLFDTSTEAFRFKTEHLSPGAYVVVLMVQDAAGNVGSTDVVFTIPARK